MDPDDDGRPDEPELEQGDVTPQGRVDDPDDGDEGGRPGYTPQARTERED